MAVDYPGCVPLPVAAEQLKVHYEVLRRMVKAKLFTEVHFSHATKRPPIYLRTEEIEAFRNGGADAVREFRKAAKSSPKRKGK